MESLSVPVLSKLVAAVVSTGWCAKFNGRYYTLRSKSGVIREEYPASEYYKISQRSLSQKFHAIDLTRESIASRVKTIENKYRHEMTMFLDSRQPCVEFHYDLYYLRADFASLLFLIRATLDEFSRLMQFISGPESNQVKSFAEVMKHVSTPDWHPAIDAKVAEFLRCNCQWFWKMRDVRDYFSHNGFVSLDLIDQNGELKILFNHRLDLCGTASEFTDGLHQLFGFFDSHYAETIGHQSGRPSTAT